MKWFTLILFALFAVCCAVFVMQSSKWSKHWTQSMHHVFILYHDTGADNSA